MEKMISRSGNSDLEINCILQARMGSKRLPGKVLLEIDDSQKIIDFIIKQLENTKINELVIAIPDNQEDDILYNHLENLKINCFRGSTFDVLDRYYQCANHFSFKHIMRLTGDNPLIDPNIVDRAIDNYSSAECDYLTNSLQRTFPYGTEIEIFTFSALQTAWKYAKKNSEREHVTPYFYNNPEKFKICHLTQTTDQSKYRYTVDRKEDLLLVRQIISSIKKRPIITQDAIELLDSNPEMTKINSSIIPNEGYLASLEED